MKATITPDSAATYDFAVGRSERPGELPDNWRYVPLRSVCEKTSIWNPVREPRDRFRYIDVSSVSNEHFRVTDAQEVAGSTAPSRARKTVKAGDVIYATVRPSLKRVAWIEPRYDGQIASTAFCVMRADRKQAVSKFLYYILLSDEVNRNIIEHERGASYPAVTDKDVLNQFVPLPPIDEQEKIAAVLWKIQKAVEIEDAIARNARDLKKSLLRRLFTHGLAGEPLKETEIGLLPESWQVASIADLTTLVYRYPTYYNINYVARGVPEVRGELLRDNGLINDNPAALRFISEETAAKFPRVRLSCGDVVMSVRGTMGKIGLVEKSLSGAVITANLIRLATNQSVIVPDFFRWALLSDAFQERLDSASSKTTIQTIPAPNLKRLQIPLREISEQREIANILQTLDRKIDIHESKKRSLQDLFKTTLHKLMTAQIRVNNLSDVETLAN
jgi:type I restriction enzyme S subunit